MCLNKLIKVTILPLHDPLKVINSCSVLAAEISCIKFQCGCTCRIGKPFGLINIRKWIILPEARGVFHSLNPLCFQVSSWKHACPGCSSCIYLRHAPALVPLILLASPGERNGFAASLRSCTLWNLNSRFLINRVVITWNASFIG